jgi:hypothetical protein
METPHAFEDTLLQLYHQSKAIDTIGTHGAEFNLTADDVLRRSNVVARFASGEDELELPELEDLRQITAVTGIVLSDRIEKKNAPTIPQSIGALDSYKIPNTTTGTDAYLLIDSRPKQPQIIAVSGRTETTLDEIHVRAITHVDFTLQLDVATINITFTGSDGNERVASPYYAHRRMAHDMDIEASLPTQQEGLIFRDILTRLLPIDDYTT